MLDARSAAIFVPSTRRDFAAARPSSEAKPVFDFVVHKEKSSAYLEWDE